MGRTAEDRPTYLLSRADRSAGPNGCWIWTGKPLWNGYGYGTRAPGSQPRSTTVHRVSYETFVGPIPPGMTIDHLCRVRLCINPAHLEVVTLRENCLRGVGAETMCKRGVHPMTEANTYVVKSAGRAPRRSCRGCRADRMRDFRARARAGPQQESN